MNRYVIKFEKNGYVKYTSHLDLLRIFKRSFKKTGFALQYSQGFNPHPKMGFAQPLSLGYSSRCELIEFETIKFHEPEDILNKMSIAMPEGLKLVSCTAFNTSTKSLAAEADSAVYQVWIPISHDISQEELETMIKDYVNQPEIVAMKRQKKTKKLAPVNIQKQIRNIKGKVEAAEDGNHILCLTMLLDCGSASNLSPELVISTFCSFAGIDTPRYEIEVERFQLNFVNNLQF
ncbi:MAG: DUF2344 domain-containing protein [Firmicutes bacterium]|jgi:radical SAM-linked protein|nr:DUF2344 domain-containing protein [Bacillota bacterium]